MNEIDNTDNTIILHNDCYNKLKDFHKEIEVVICNLAKCEEYKRRWEGAQKDLVRMEQRLSNFNNNNLRS